MITSFFIDINRYLRIRMHQCYRCDRKVEFRTQMKTYYCQNCKKHIIMDKTLKLEDVESVTKKYNIDTDTGILDIITWKS